MWRELLKSKIYGAKVTLCQLNYEGSISIDEKIMKAANLIAGEKVHVLNLNNGARFETFVIPAKAGSGEIGLFGPAARLGQVGDGLVILSYIFIEEKKLKNHHPITVYVDSKNNLLRVKKE